MWQSSSPRCIYSRACSSITLKASAHRPELKMLLTVYLLALLGIPVGATITIEYPNSNSRSWDLSSPLLIQWSYFSENLSHFRIVLRNYSPYYYEVVAPSVATSTGRYTLMPLDVPTATGYQLEFLSISASADGEILARSTSFAVEGQLSGTMVSTTPL